MSERKERKRDQQLTPGEWLSRPLSSDPRMPDNRLTLNVANAAIAQHLFAAYSARLDRERLLATVSINDTMTFMEAHGVDATRLGPYDAVVRLTAKLSDRKTNQFPIKEQRDYAESIVREWCRYEDLVVAWNHSIMMDAEVFMPVRGDIYTLKRIAWSTVSSNAMWQRVVQLDPAPGGFRLAHFRVTRSTRDPNANFRQPCNVGEKRKAPTTDGSETKRVPLPAEAVDRAVDRYVRSRSMGMVLIAWVEIVSVAIKNQLATAQGSCTRNFAGDWVAQTRENMIAILQQAPPGEHAANQQHVALLAAVVARNDLSAFNAVDMHRIYNCQLQSWQRVSQLLRLMQAGSGVMEGVASLQRVAEHVQTAVRDLQQRIAQLANVNDLLDEAKRTDQRLIHDLSEELTKMVEDGVDVLGVAQQFFGPDLVRQINEGLEVQRVDVPQAMQAIQAVTQSLAGVAAEVASSAAKEEKEAAHAFTVIQQVQSDGITMHETFETKNAATAFTDMLGQFFADILARSGEWVLAANRDNPLTTDLNLGPFVDRWSMQFQAVTKRMDERKWADWLLATILTAANAQLFSFLQRAVGIVRPV